MTMSKRAYTVSEVDALKSAHENKLVFGFYSGAPFTPNREGYSATWRRSIGLQALACGIESGVRISMRAGHTADDLLASE
jgi:hypothetical protein